MGFSMIQNIISVLVGRKLEPFIHFQETTTFNLLEYVITTLCLFGLLCLFFPYTTFDGLLFLIQSYFT